MGRKPSPELVLQDMQDQATRYKGPTGVGYKRKGKRLPTELRPFVGWDGEGITYDGDKQQSYVLFGASTGDRIIDRQGLSSAQCFELLLRVKQANPFAIHVGFALQYDVNMMLRDLEPKHLWYLYTHGEVKWSGYKITYRPGKWVTIKRHPHTIRLYDVFGFFQSSFVKACEAFLGKNDPELVRIREGKLARAAFTFDQLTTFIIPYWEGELRLLVRLMESLRDDLITADIRLSSWHGPGAVASAVLRSNNIALCKDEPPKEVNRAAQYAYAGGRFELFRCGHHPTTVWEYDIRSAYPSAIADLPNLNRGTWEPVSTFEPQSFGVWRISHDDGAPGRELFTKPQPLFHRDSHGAVSYPPLVQGWYWTPEAALVSRSEIKEGWVFRSDDDKPFSFVRQMYVQRQQWKSQGNSAEKALKLALNSLYGKMAQRQGWQSEGDAIPQWHQLEWAGYVTSATRAKIWQAMQLAGDDLIAVETDAVFSSKPLPLDIGTALGQWEEMRFDWITYLQSGLYFAGQNGEVIERYRGFDKGSLPYAQVVDFLGKADGPDWFPLTGRTTRFVGLGLGLRTRLEWRSWVTDDRNVSIGGGGKRTHVRTTCKACRDGVRFNEGLHQLSVVTAGGRSEPHSLPWLAGMDSELRVMDELSRW